MFSGSIFRRFLLCQRHFSISSPEVLSAASKRGPRLALESTIITHGLPYPENISMAKSAHQICFENGVTPATIALLDGTVRVGLTDEELERLSQTDDAVKVSRRDIAPAIARGKTGGTTVSGTMIIAHQNNIDIFSTGGIGGVHRGGEGTMDVSADLTELGRTPVCVVCAGVKSILDIGRTLEYLETQGVTVATLGKSREFPAFFTPTSGFHAHTNVESAREAAEMVFVNKKMQLGSGMVVAVPIPEEHAADGEAIEQAIQQALAEVEKRQIAGNAVTPYVLERVSQLTGGASLRTNLALVRNNVLAGAQIARHLHELETREEGRRWNTETVEEGSRWKTETVEEGRQWKAEEGVKRGGVVVVGACNVDILSSSEEDSRSSGKDLLRGTVRHVAGGVGRNVAECVARCGTPCTLVSAVGRDLLGRFVLERCGEVEELAVERVRQYSGGSTTLALLNLQGGNVRDGVSDFSGHAHITPDLVERGALAGASCVLLDCDVPLETALRVTELCGELGIPLVVEPTAPLKFRQFYNAGILSSAAMVTPNDSELDALPLETPPTPVLPASTPSCVQKILPRLLSCLSLLSSSATPRTVISTLGAEGAVCCQLTPCDTLTITYCPAAPTLPSITSASGAGDSFTGGFLSMAGSDVGSAMEVGTACAVMSLGTYRCVSSRVSREGVEEAVREWKEEHGWGSRVLYHGPLP